jgi:hypothetical protein
MNLIDAAERGWLPDWLIRRGIRRLFAERLRQEDRIEPDLNRDAARAFADQVRRGPLAIEAAPSAVPTPSSFTVLIGMGAMGLVAVARRRKKA